jgi:periplasmic divalent cation tolerance protein
VAVVSVYCVFADRDEAERIGRAVIEERLAACINILPGCHSIYRWEDRVETASEVPALLKTSAGRVDSLIVRIAALHSYEVPAIAVWPIDKLPASYAEWVEQNTG